METERNVYVYASITPVYGYTASEYKCGSHCSPIFTMIFGIIFWLGVFATLIAPVHYTKTVWTDDQWISPDGWVGVYANKVNSWGETEPDHIYTVEFVAIALNAVGVEPQKENSSMRHGTVNFVLHHFTEYDVCNKTMFQANECVMFHTIRTSKSLIISGSIIGMIGIILMIPFRVNNVIHVVACIFLIVSLTFQYVSVKIVSNNIKMLNDIPDHVQMGMGETPNVQYACAIVNSVFIPLCIIALTITRKLYKNSDKI